MKRKLRIAAIALTLILVGLQFVPVERSNPLGAGDPAASRETMWILRRACYDCHSYETRWPIWAYVAPMSWQVIADVERARSILNFSQWQALDPSQRVSHRALINPVTSTHRMPTWYYLTLHPDAKLSPRDHELLEQWSAGALEELPPSPATVTGEAK